MQKHLIIIPGIGDDHAVYHLGARIFRLFGYSTHVKPFGWDDADPQQYQRKYSDFCEFVASLSGAHYLLGVSAGGALANTITYKEPELITRTVTLCAPLIPFENRINPLLEVALTDSARAIRGQTQAAAKMTSLYAVYDQTVPKQLSKPAGIRAYPLLSAVHAVTIFLGLTIYAPVVAHFLKQR